MSTSRKRVPVMTSPRGIASVSMCAGMKMTPDMVKMSADMMAKVSPEDLAKMAQMRAGGAPAAGAASSSAGASQNIEDITPANAMPTVRAKALLFLSLPCLCPSHDYHVAQLSWTQGVYLPACLCIWPAVSSICPSVYMPACLPALVCTCLSLSLYVSVSACPCLLLYVCVCVSICLSVSSVCPPAWLPMCVRVCLYLDVCVCVCLYGCLYLYVCVYVCLSLSLSLCVSVSVCLSMSVCSVCVHVGLPACLSVSIHYVSLR